MGDGDNIPGAESFFEEGPKQANNIDYLQLAKGYLDTLRSRSPSPLAGGRLRVYDIEEATLAVQIALVEATQERNRLFIEDVQRQYDQPICVHGRLDSEGCLDCQDDPPEEDSGEDCVHSVNVGSDCGDCTERLSEEPEATLQNIADRVENQND